MIVCYFSACFLSAQACFLIANIHDLDCACAGIGQGSTIKKPTENFKVAGAHQGIADIMKQGQFQALHALRVQKGFQDCKTENGASVLVTSRSLPRCALSVLLRLIMRCQALWSILRQWFKESLGQLRRSVF